MMKNQEKYKQPQPVAIPKTGGYPVFGAKTSGIKIRGTGAATKGKMSRGPMA
jgi:hypothetical protein